MWWLGNTVQQPASEMINFDRNPVPWYQMSISGLIDREYISRIGKSTDFSMIRYQVHKLVIDFEETLGNAGQ